MTCIECQGCLLSSGIGQGHVSLSGRRESMGCRMDALVFILCEAVVLHVLEGKRDVNFSSSLQLIESRGRITISVNIIKPRGNTMPQEGWAHDSSSQQMQMFQGNSLFRTYFYTRNEKEILQIPFGSLPLVHRSGPCQLLWSSEAAVFLEALPYIKQGPEGFLENNCLSFC